MERLERNLSDSLDRAEGAGRLSSDEVSQLRNAIASSSVFLQRMNALAASGSVRGFVIEKAGGGDFPCGQYDGETGVINLPASAFSSASSKPSPDLVATVRLQTIVATLAGSSGKHEKESHVPATAELVSNLQDTINGSQFLAEELKRAVLTPASWDRRRTLLERIEVTNRDGSGGTYDGSALTITLPPSSLAPSTRGGVTKFHVEDITFVLGHETQHAFNFSAAMAATNRFRSEMKSIAHSKPERHNYTQTFQAYLTAARLDEASAEIAGWNALLSRQKVVKPGLTLNQMVESNDRTLDFVNRKDGPGGDFVGKPDIAINPDMTIDQTRENIESLAKHYFDRPPLRGFAYLGDERPMTLGGRSESDYRNHYIKGAIKEVFEEEATAERMSGRTHQVTIDMAALGLSEELIERGGLDLGKEHSRRPYIDSSYSGSELRHFDHTVSGENKYTYIPINSAGLDLSSESHPDHAMFQRTRLLVHQLDREKGRIPDERSDCLAASLVVEARRSGMSQVDEISLSDDASQVWAFQHRPGDRNQVFTKEASVPTVVALDTPMDRSAADWTRAIDHFSEVQALEAQQQLQREAMEQTRSQEKRMSM